MKAVCLCTIGFIALMSAACTTTKDGEYVTGASLESKGMTPLKGEEIRELVSGKTLIGHYVSTPQANFGGFENIWMESFTEDGRIIYQYCESRDSERWTCGNRVDGTWDVKDDTVCFSYPLSNIFNRCFKEYKDGDGYLAAATTGKNKGFVRARTDKILSDFDIPPPFHQ